MLGRAIVLVREDQLSLAIGRRGQNVRLASKLSGWDIEIMTQEELAESIDRAVQGFSVIDGIETELAERLVEEGFLSYDDLTIIEPDALMEMGGLTAEQVDHVVEQAEAQAEEAETAAKEARRQKREQDRQAAIQADIDAKEAAKEAANAEKEAAEAELSEESPTSPEEAEAGETEESVDDSGTVKEKEGGSEEVAAVQDQDTPEESNTEESNTDESNTDESKTDESKTEVPAGPSGEGSE